MIAIIVIAQLAAAQVGAADSAYSSAAVRAFVTAAAAENERLARVMPPYRAKVESELAWVLQDSIDRERIFVAQQFASDVQWKRGLFEIMVKSARPAFLLPQSVAWPTTPTWLVPALYGERVPFVFSEWSTPRRRGSQREKSIVTDTVFIEHPFERERERRYTYSGGDTVATIRVASRIVTVVRIHVVPHATPTEVAAAIEGDLFVDAERHQLVRLRCRIIRFAPVRRGPDDILRATGAAIAPYLEVTNEEVGGTIWLPHTERVEMQFRTGLFFGIRELWRHTATFSQHVIETTDVADSAQISPAPQISVHMPSLDSLGQTHRWALPLGTGTHAAHSTDFVDIAPSVWRDDGPPHFTMEPSQTSRLIRVNPVEGVYTGLEGTLNFRDLAPGLAVRGFGGWAWSENTARGGGALMWKRNSRVISLFAQRAIETTNDFVTDIPVSDPFLAELLGIAEQRDYVDRVSTALSWSDIRRSAGDAIVTAQIGFGRDRSERTRFTHTLLRPSDSLLPNRAATGGSYARFALDYELHPDVSFGSVLQGLGAHLRYEAAGGDLSWERASVAAIHRSVVGPFNFSERFDAGVVAAPREIPPQQLFELGGGNRLGGYAYKQFAGDRIATGSIGVVYLIPALRNLRVVKTRWLPPLAPGLSTGVELGWSTLSAAGTRSVLAMSDPPASVPLSVATDGVRGSYGAGFTLFSGLLHVGYARSFDPGAQWRRVVGFGTAY